jgi:hypothetical protein
MSLLTPSASAARREHNMPLLTSTMIDRYVDDLLRARPQGPNHPYTKITYEQERTGERWCKKDYEYKDVFELIPSHPTWGYTQEQIFSIGLMERDDVDTYVRKRWFGGKGSYSLGRKKATATRRINRIWGRMDDVIRKVKREGGTGIYNVRAGYYSGDGEFGNIYATSPEEAKRFAEMFFGYLLIDNNRIRVEFVRYGTPPEVIALNAQTMQRASDSISSWEEDIIKLKKRIEQKKMRIETLSMIEAQQLAVEDE